MFPQAYRSLGLLLSLYVLDTTATPPKYGVVVPNDPFKFVGDKLILLCNITNPAVREDSSWLYFQRVTLKSKGFLLPKRSIHKLNTKSIQLELPRIKIDDEGVYECFQQRDVLGSSPRYIGRQKVQVEYRPKSVERVDCRVYNWESMKCNWSLGHQYNHPENINVSLVWTTNRRQKSCPMLTHTSCEWPSGLYSHNHVYLMRISVDVIVHNQVLKRALSPMFTIRTGLHVQPAPIHEFQASEENSTCIGLIWSHLSPKRRKKYFVLEYRKNNSDVWTKIDLESWTMTDMRVLVCGLIAFTKYTFRMSVLPFPEKSLAMSAHGYPSKWTYISARTREDVPSCSPPFCQSCYHQQNCPEYVDDPECRLVRIYWREVPESQRNGEIIKYSVRFQNDAVPFLHNYESKQVVNEVFQISNIKYEVHLRAATVKGFSSIPSLLTLPANDKKPLQPEKFLVETDHTTKAPFVHYLSWASVLTHPFNYTNIVVVWCERAKSTSACKGNINWIHLASETVTYELVLYKKIDINIGIAAEAFDGKIVVSSGIKWASCIYQRHKKPNNGPNNVHWASVQPDKGLTVLWDKSDCTKEDVFVTEYSISICRTLDEIMCHEPTVSQTTFTKTEVTFHNLIPGKKYLVRIWAMSSAGYGPSSEPIVKKVHEKKIEELDSSFIIGFGLIIIVILLFFCFITCLCFRNCSHAKEKILKFHKFIKRHLKAQKKPLNPPSRFQNRPLPEPPAAEKIYYGLSACMINHGSRRPQNNRKLKDQRQQHVNGMNTNCWNQKPQQQECVKKRQGQNNGKQDFYSFYLKQNTDVFQEPADKVAQNGKAGVTDNGGYSLANHSSDVLENSQPANVSRKKSNDNCHNANISSGIKSPASNQSYEIPISPDDVLEFEKAQWFFHQRETLLSRARSKKVVMGVRNGQKSTEQIVSPCVTNSDLSNQQHTTALTKLTPTVPFYDSPPPSFPAPLPPHRNQCTPANTCVKRQPDISAQLSCGQDVQNVPYLLAKNTSLPLNDKEMHEGAPKAKPSSSNHPRITQFPQQTSSSKEFDVSQTEGAYQYLSGEPLHNYNKDQPKDTQLYHTLMESSEVADFTPPQNNNNTSSGLRSHHPQKASPMHKTSMIDSSAKRKISLSSETLLMPPAPAPSPVTESEFSCSFSYTSSASIDSCGFVDDNDNYIQCPDANVRNPKNPHHDSSFTFTKSQTKFI